MRVAPWLRSKLGIYADHRLWWMTAVALWLVGMMVANVALHGFCQPYTAAVVCCVAASLILFLVVHSTVYLQSILMAAQNEGLKLLMATSSKINETIREEARILSGISASERAEHIKKHAQALLGQFRSYPVVTAVLGRLLKRASVNLFLTVAGFAVFSTGLVLHDEYNGGEAQWRGVGTYGHQCIDHSSLAATLGHLFYYHAVLFQSLGDGQHAPRTLAGEITGTSVAFLGFFYLIFFLGGSLSVSMFVHADWTPDKLVHSVEQYFLDQAPESDPEVPAGQPS